MGNPVGRPPGGGKTPGSGRVAGTPNKLTRDVKEAISNAFTKVGGEDYLVIVAHEKPEVFCTLLGKILPRQVDQTGAMEILYRIHRGPKPE